MPEDDIPRYRLADYLSTHGRFFAARMTYRSGTSSRWHRHDFAEFFWLSSGRCRHSFHGGSETIGPGDLRFVQPDHAHNITTLPDHTGVLNNVALPSDFIAAWGTLYPELAPHFFWAPSKRPTGFSLNEASRRELEARMDYLTHHPENLMLLHETMLHLFREVLTNFEAETSPQPAWLQTGLRALKSEAVREGGVPAFAQACGRSPEHVSRTTRRLLGKTPGELVNESRMDYAAQRLRMSHAKILDIMMDCGIANSGYFYQLFRQRYGLTPHAYRRQSFKVF